MYGKMSTTGTEVGMFKLCTLSMGPFDWEMVILEQMFFQRKCIKCVCVLQRVCQLIQEKVMKLKV